SLTYLYPKINHKIIYQWQEFKPDIIHFNKQNLEDGLDLLSWVNFTKIPSITTIHITQTQASLGSFIGKWRDQIAKISLAGYKGKIVAISDNRGKELKNFLASLYPSDDIFTINNGVRIVEESERLEKRKLSRIKLNISSDELFIIAVGRMESQKQPLLFLQWAKYLAKKLSSVRFLWVGEGRLTPLWDQWIIENKAQEYIQHLGWQNDVTPFLAAADGFFHTASFEGLPFALLEAMAWHLPCAITSELAQDLELFSGNCFVVTEQNNFQQLDEFMNIRNRVSVAQKGYQLIKEKFSLSSMINKYIYLYNAVKM
ncbi:MAG: glycosyltransferase family 4 protein, partial [Sphaerospermopsis sp. SIO1G2]|nr:glycosyltransferase family 4 protein [Sphaerospermopsis sp. SIO1G2]